jgi:hypothetical protein
VGFSADYVLLCAARAEFEDYLPKYVGMLIYLLATIGLAPGGSSTVHIY